MKTKKKVKKIIFPKGCTTLHIPFMTPIGWDERAQTMIGLAIQSYGTPSENIDIKFTYELLLSSEGHGYDMTQVSFIKNSLKPKKK